ncbi:MAG: hypothetical protein AUJ86_04970 [Hydrogenophilaceae bacterium CG1_02_62_390]|nr:hypothetical protein [Betaproteobacteria bacterium]OIO78371.1 MAG: hypothetical protein AUJ86_04970 [Hydrogenophilaceae bacterium CG1_02_62_390]
MAESSPSPEQLALRRSARRRLLGAIALALLAVVVLPMVFDPEPKPMGSNVEVRIPGQSTPFEPAAPMTAPQPAEATPAPDGATVLPEPEPPSETVKSAPDQHLPTVAQGKPMEKPKAVDKPMASRQPKPVEVKAEAKPARADRGYLLQLGSFASEANARQSVAQAKAAGFKASAVKIAGQFKVRVGPIADKAQAQDYQAKLKAKGLAAVLIE